MPDQDDKAKKLKEIQDRLAEIQKKTDKVPAEVKKPTAVKKDEPAKVSNVAKEIPKVDKEIKQQAVDAKPAIKSPPKEVEIEKPAASKRAVETNKSLTQEEKNWRSNKLKVDKADKKVEVKGKNKLTKVYTAISLIVTLAVCSYFIYAFFIKSDSNDVVESKIPIEQNEVDITSEGENEVLTEEEVEEEIDEVAVEEVEDVVVEKPKKEAPPKKVVQPKEEKVRPIATATTSTVAAVVPKGVIISYSSNSTKDLAANNVQILKSKGFKAAYYYMPDKNSSAPSLYKVYVGPYANESAAMSDFKKIVEINDKAFILRAD